MPARSAEAIALPAVAPLGAVEEWIRRQRGVPKDCAAPLAALLEFYGRRAGEPASARRERKRLIRSLKRLTAVRPPHDDETMDAEVKLLRLEQQRGGLWPIDARDEQFSVELWVERGLALRKGRGVTDDTIFMTLGTMILRTRVMTGRGALRVLLPVLSALGYEVPLYDASAAPTVSNTLGALAEYRAALEHSEVDDDRHALSPEGVRSAYVALAKRLGAAAPVRLPRALPA